MMHHKDEVIEQLNLIIDKTKKIKECEKNDCIKHHLDDIAYIARLVTADLDSED